MAKLLRQQATPCTIERWLGCCAGLIFMDCPGNALWVLEARLSYEAKQRPNNACVLASKA